MNDWHDDAPSWLDDEYFAVEGAARNNHPVDGSPPAPADAPDPYDELAQLMEEEWS